MSSGVVSSLRFASAHMSYAFSIGSGHLFTVYIPQLLLLLAGRLVPRGQSRAPRSRPG